MKIQYLFAATALLLSLPAAAQETYENAKLMGNNELNGTARYVGMGGAMEALGADISTMNTNPAGIGLFRHTTASISGGMVSQSDVPSYATGDKTHASFDQVGFVYALRSGKNSFLNFGFNYSKSRNFDFILAASNSLSNASANKATYLKWANVAQSGQNLMNTGAYSQWDDLNNGAANMQTDSMYSPSDGYLLSREHTGYIGDYSFNISGNIHDRLYLGVTFTYRDVHYHHKGNYTENGFYDGSASGANVNYYDRHEIEGDGFNIKFGAILRPIETSPFRFGVYVETPTWYDLTTRNNSNTSGGFNNVQNSMSYDFKIYTPWKFGLSLGHTVGNYLALGATYEYSDYGSTKTRIDDGVYDDGWGAYDTSHNDDAMNDHTSETLKGVSTLKLGVEFKPVDNLSVRLGYNYVSAMYEENGRKGMYENNDYISSNGIYVSSTGDYTNWKSTNRFTCGIGYTFDKFAIDLAYQYSAQKGDFHPFANDFVRLSDGTTDENIANVSEVKNNRNQLLLTLSYHF